MHGRLARERMYPVSSARDLLLRDYERPSYSTSSPLFLDLSAGRAFLSSFYASFGYQLYQFYTELDRARLVSAFLFSLDSSPLPSLSPSPRPYSLSENGRAGDKSSFDCYTSRELRPHVDLHFICPARLSIFATLLHYVGETHLDPRR